MKKHVDICKKKAFEKKAILCDHVTTPDGIIPLLSPILSTEKSCDWCSGSDCYCPYVGSGNPTSKTWLCANVHCDVYIKRSLVKMTRTIPKRFRAILWPVWCELNGIGDLCYDIRFENLDQDAKKVSYMLKFAQSPRNILLMQGDKGTGKTYACLAICELFTRNNTSCTFTTQKGMADKWLDTFDRKIHNEYINSLKNVCLLVIDDFGTGDIPQGFLTFFMDLINYRIQWKEKGTIITTNLSETKITFLCGEPFSDRLNTGMIFKYEGKTKRKKNVL